MCTRARASYGAVASIPWSRTSVFQFSVLGASSERGRGCKSRSTNRHSRAVRLVGGPGIGQAPRDGRRSAILVYVYGYVRVRTAPLRHLPGLEPLSLGPEPRLIDERCVECAQGIDHRTDRSTPPFQLAMPFPQKAEGVSPSPVRSGSEEALRSRAWGLGLGHCALSLDS